MPKSDQKYFNCSEQHEYNYVVNQYTNSSEVRQTLKDLCKKHNNMTHKFIYDELEKLGYKKKKKS